MPEQITLEVIDRVRGLATALVTEHARRLPGLRYADVRIEVSEGKAGVAENGTEKFSGQDYAFSAGIRVIGGAKLAAPGFYGRQLGAADLPHLERILREGLEHAHGRALANAEAKARAREELGVLGRALWSTELAPIPVRQDTVPAEYTLDPRTVPLEEVLRAAREASAAVQGVSPQVVFNYVSAQTGLERLLFASSEGAEIDQTWAISEGMVYVVAQSDTGSAELYDWIGHQRGWEVIARGTDGEYIQFPPLLEFAVGMARDTVELAGADPLPATEDEVVVVTDPHFNALVAHEVVGHPTELDRALKMETAYAGRCWLLRSLEETQIGKRVGSPLVNAFSDPGLPGYGHYKYDDEGTPARRVTLIEDGIFRNFMNSRETAAILEVEPNGSYKATDASLVPLIRMSNTFFGPGTQDPQDIIREVDRGYYVVGHRIPSVSESRENFRITAQKVYEIRNGEIGKLYRDGGITADSKDFFLSIDAVGTDFRLFSIPNCGKGQPMQTKRLGNGGPTMRGRARLTGV
ncbi:MAG TPA: TldD/PmbA family protein [Dehalococcoidia bacterium]